MTPPLQISIEIVEVETRHVVVAEVPPVAADQRPVYVTTQGISGGSYLRGGDGDRLAMLREDYLTNEMLRQWGVDRIAAGQVLRDLVDQGLAVKEGGRRYARYILDPTTAGSTKEPALVPDVAEALRSRGEATAGELVELTGLSRSAVLNHLRALTDSGTAAAIGAARSPKRLYRWIGQPSARR